MSLVLDPYSLKTLAHPLERVSAAMRHAVIGINCYQHAVGYPHVLITDVKRATKKREAVTRFNYLALIPGKEQRYEHAGAQEKDIENIIKKCGEDGLEDAGKECPVQQDDERRIALYMNGPYFHFTHIDKNGNTSSKTPDREIQNFAGIPKEIIGFELKRFFRAPKLVVSAYVAKRMPEVRYEIMDNEVVSFAVIDNPGAHSADTITINEMARIARFVEYRREVPMPALPNFRLDRKYQRMPV